MRFSGRAYDLRKILNDAATQIVLIDEPGRAPAPLPPRTRFFPAETPQLLSQGSSATLLIAGLLLTHPV
ncbi:MAG: hypothetical protein EOP21_10340 [Hyphomicrobiales bacterium]|nr:MAG: hypothetical protein EOP21_10340 [Hyphomicrobiales bacterium]